MTLPSPIPIADSLPVWGWFCEPCNVKWGAEAGQTCWSCGKETDRHGVLPLASLAASIDDIVLERAS